MKGLETSKSRIKFLDCQVYWLAVTLIQVCEVICHHGFTQIYVAHDGSMGLACLPTNLP